jgi:hypothetical protein
MENLCFENQVAIKWARVYLLLKETGRVAI